MTFQASLFRNKRKVHTEIYLYGDSVTVTNDVSITLRYSHQILCVFCDLLKVRLVISHLNAIYL